MCARVPLVHLPPCMGGAQRVASNVCPGDVTQAIRLINHLSNPTSSFFEIVSLYVDLAVQELNV